MRPPSYSNRMGEGGHVSIAWRQTMYQTTAPWHPYGQAGCLYSHARTSQPTVTKEEVRDGVLRSVILGTTVGVQSDLIVVIVTFVPSAGPVLIKQCIAQPTPLPANH